MNKKLIIDILPPAILNFLRKVGFRFVYKKLCHFSQVVNFHGKILLKKVFPPKTPVNPDGIINVHLGCGNVNHPKFINIDGYPFPNVHYAQRIDKLPQFKDSEVNLIYASHCLEHFHYTNTEVVLKEWFRVLCKGGVLRLSVPDFDLLLKIYSENGNDPDLILPQLMGGQNNKYNFHYTALNEVNLSRLLLSVGFSKIRIWTPGQDDLTTFDDFSIYKKEVNQKFYEVSLNIEAEK